MIKNEELTTSPKQRIVIVLVALLMLGSTFALYAGIVLNYNNNTETSQAKDEKQQRFEELYAEYQEKLDAQAKELSNIYFEEFSKYRSNVKSFNAAGATELKVNDLKVGEQPLEGSENMIEGWLEGISHYEEDGTHYWDGMRIGGIREITIPAALAYGDKEQGTIPANSPLKFVIMLIEKPEEIEVPAELEELYSELYG